MPKKKKEYRALIYTINSLHNKREMHFSNTSVVRVWKLNFFKRYFESQMGFKKASNAKTIMFR